MGPPLDESLPSPMDPTLLTYLHHGAGVYIVYMVEHPNRIEVIRIDPLDS